MRQRNIFLRGFLHKKTTVKETMECQGMLPKGFPRYMGFFAEAGSGSG